jgi:hypothetical protein
MEEGTRVENEELRVKNGELEVRGWRTAKRKEKGLGIRE